MTQRALVLASFVVVLLAACENGAQLGTPCARSSDCAAPLACRLDRCRSECAANRDCPLGTRCLLDHEGRGSCSLETDDACHAGDCAAPTLCIEGRCRNLCGGTALCPDGNECVAGPLGDVCIEEPTEDAGTSDASIDAGALPDANVAPGRALDVCTGAGFACAITAARGHVHCWGANEDATLGDGLLTHSGCVQTGGGDCSIVPVLVAREDDGVPVEGAVQLGCGEDHACARLGSGDVVCWGRNVNGALGTDDYGGTFVRAVRVEISGLATDLEVGRSTSCARVGDDWACWGENGHAGVVDGRLGVPTFDGEFTAVPIVVPAFRGARVALAATTTCFALGADVACVGDNARGQVGVPLDAVLYRSPPTTLTLAGPIDELAAGGLYFCAVVSGTALCWGDNDRCAIARETTETPEVPTPIDDTVWRSIVSAGTARTTCGVRDADGSVACWGESGLGEAGVATASTCARTSVLRDDGGPLVASILALGCAIDPTGSPWCWGNNTTGALMLPPDTTPHPRAVRVVVPE